MRRCLIALLAIVNRLAEVDHPVSDSLQFSCNLHSRGDEPEVSSHRLMKGQELQTRFFQIDVHSVHVDVRFDDRASAANIVLTQARKRRFDLRDNQVAHFIELRSQFGKFDVKFLVLMFHWMNSGFQ